MAAAEPPKPRIAIVTYNIHNLGGVPRSTTTIANSLNRRGYTVELISIAPGMIPVAQQIDSEIPVFTCNQEVPRSQQFYSNGVGARGRQLALRLFRRWKPRNLRLVRPTADGVDRLTSHLAAMDLGHTIVIVTDVNSMDYVGLALQRLEARPLALIGQFRGTVEALSPSRLRRISDAFSDVDLMLLLTEEDARAFRAATNVDCDWVPNPVPTAPESASERAEPREVVTLGRLAPEKGLDKAIEAWGLLGAKNADWTLRIFGDGPLYRPLQDQIDAAGLSGSVHLEGKTEDSLGVLRKATIHLLPSQHEGFGMSVAEASSVGTPTVAFDCSPGVRSQITHDVDGVLVPVNDVGRLAEELQLLMDDAARIERLGRAAAQSVQRFSVAAVMARWDELFADLARKSERDRSLDSGHAEQ
ncbi:MULTISPECIES: glycosyltransferase [unclassified Microbacterium]|uniref:glycosyltransferase n=1 Tax=unclassified Microbacterium TaxID=2609290 RepID=UPI001604F9D4|nr:MULTISPECIES: glycosyltransferase [unclassified Microbacterium]QNA91988.1 glycosyltransferase family 4 protein [Microbacterium sp. Se63.02b]QYM65218.1 glycosyltransferase [Microbacterium sp. Se5.02b]